MLLGTLPAALPCWNMWLRDSLGRIVTIEQWHVVEYAGLGWLVGLYAESCERPWRTTRRWIIVGALIGLLDELVQACVPQRVFQWSDVALNELGLLLGVGVRGLGASGIGWSRRRRGSRELKG